MKVEPQDVNKWLTKVTDDQNLQDIDEIEITRMDGIRRWFHSRLLQPIFHYGNYNKLTGKVELGTRPGLGDLENIVIEEDATSAAARNFTSATENRLIWYIGVISDRAPLYGITVTDGVTTITLPGMAGTGTANIEYSLLPGGAMTGVGVSSGKSPYPFYLPAGWVIETTEANFVAADATVRHYAYSVVR